MKNLLITYQMRNHEETALTSIVLPMEDDTAAEILSDGDELPPEAMHVKLALKQISLAQGYVYVGYVGAEEVE